MSIKRFIPGYSAISTGLRRLRNWALLPWLACIVLVIRLLRPLVLIRIGTINGARIGHFVYETDLYLCERKAGLHPRRSLDLFYYSSPPCNAQMDRLFRRALRIAPWVRRLDAVNRALPGGEAHTVKILGRDLPGMHRDPHNLVPRTPACIRLTPEEVERGERELEAIGVPRGAPLVCIHNRDSAYLDRLYPGYDWSYHNYRDFPVGDFREAVDELIERGYYVVRMGQDVAEPLEHPSPRVIDYASLETNDFLDVYLCSRCEFFVGNTSGLFHIATAFRRPVISVNYLPYIYLVVLKPFDLVLPMLLYDEGAGRVLTLAEAVSTGAGTFYATEEYEQAGVRVITNSPAEIRDVVVQMLDRLAGDDAIDQHDERLQWRFRQTLEASEYPGEFRTPVGAAFLRQHAQALGIDDAAVERDAA